MSCPHCGYCEHCGRSNGYQYPYNRPYYSGPWYGNSTPFAGLNQSVSTTEQPFTAATRDPIQAYQDMKDLWKKAQSDVKCDHSK